MDKQKISFEYVTAQELLDNPPNQPSHIVENLITPGLTILAAAPKSGKSYLLTHILANISRGTRVFLNRRVQKCKVLYMGLEDGVTRFHKRLQDFNDKDILDGSRALDDFYIVTENEQTGLDFIHRLENEIAEQGFRVVVIDVLHKIFDPKKRFGYTAQYDMMNGLQKCAERTNTAIIVVHHTNKKASKGLNSISGTSGLTAAADNIFILNKSDESWKDAYIHLNVQGRDIEPQDIWLEHNLSNMGYAEMPHKPLSAKRTKDLQQIVDLRKKGKSQTEIAKSLNISQATVSRGIGQIKSTPSIVRLSDEEAKKLWARILRGYE